MAAEAHHHGEPVRESPYAERIRAIEALLVRDDYVTPRDVDRQRQIVASKSAANGARIVARAWTDERFRLRLLADFRGAAREFGHTIPPGVEFMAVENSPSVHHLVVCTLCSCYPRAILGPPPRWYKSFAYRSRAVRDPRGVLRDFGFELPPDVAVQVRDSTADLRYMVLPMRPSGTEGWSEEALAGTVTARSLIGTGNPEKT